MEGSFMNGLWKKRIPAFFLTLVMIVSLMPAALAVDPCPDGNHDWKFTYNDTEHYEECNICGAKQNGRPHLMGSPVTTTAPTCYSTGVSTTSCSGCDYKITSSIDKIEHEYQTTWSSDSEQHYHACKNFSNCSAKQDASGHTWATAVTIPSTCTTKGRVEQTCTECQYKKIVNELDLAAHTPGPELKHNDTTHWNECTVCHGKVNEVPHNYTLNNNTTCACGAVKAANTFVVRFFNGSSLLSTQNIPLNGKPTVPGNPSKGTGYTFRGWVTSNPGNNLWTSSTSTVTNPGDVAVSGPVDYYAIYSVNGTTPNVTIEATTAIGGTLWSQISSKCTGSYGFSPQYVRFSLPSSVYGTLYSDSTQRYAVAPNTDYQYGGVISMTFKSGSSNGYSLSYTAYDVSRSNTVSGTIFIGSSASTNKIEYTVAAGRSKVFNDTDFRNLYRNASGTSASLYYVVFSAPIDYSDYGVVSVSSRDFTRSNLSSYKFYYSSSRDGDYALGSTSFKADSKSKSGTLSIPFTAYGSGNNVSGTLEITVSGAAKGDVSYNVDPGREIDFDSRDFNKAFQDKYNSTRYTLYYVTFSAPTGYSSFRGTVYVGNTSFDRSKLNNAYFFYDSRDAGVNDYELDRMSFKADSNAKDGDSITIPFRAYYGRGSSDYVECNLVITIGKGTDSGDINYDVAPGKTVTFRQRDFREFYEDNASGTFDYVEFDQPSSSAFDNGTLYHNYGTSSSKSFNRTTIDDQKFYYSPSSSQHGIGNLTFVASNNFKETITLDFTAYGTNGRSVSGRVAVASTESANDGDITYTVAPGKYVDLRRTDFNTYFRRSYNSTVSYVVFQRPSSTVFNDGMFYCDYGTASQTTFGRSDLGGTKFYYDKNDAGRNDYYLDELTFAAGSGFKNSITLDFTAYGERSDEYVEGTVVIKADTTAISSNYTGSIRYTTTGTNVQINANDIARYFKQTYPSYSLQYVTLGGVPATGGLYYNYYNASSYGITSRTQITAANCAGLAFYLSPTATTQYALTELTYVPSGTGYCATIPFTAYGTGSVSVTGSILISVSRAPVSEVYGITPRNTAVSFPAGSIYSAVLTATGSSLSGIQLLALPAATSGTVYVGTGVDRADTRTVYTYATGTNSMSSLRFVPTAAFTGSVEIPYVALDASGNALASGTFSLGVLNNRKTLKDVNSATWCYKYVMELTDQNVISGYSDGSFKPNSTVTYGAALKLIMLAAGYPEQAPTGKNVFSGYLARAQADGIVTRSNVNLTAPITRLQVAQIAAGALKLSTSNLSSVKPFTDTSDVYVQALNAAGIVEGYFSNGTSTYRPSSTLNRGQMSAIVWRMNQYRK